MAATAIYRILGRGPSSAELVQKRPKVPKQPDAFRKFTRPGTEPGPGPGPGPVPGPERGLELELELESNSSKTVQMAKYAKRETAQSHRLDPAPYRFRYKNIDVLV
jgi:hypothetical protein